MKKIIFVGLLIGLAFLAVGCSVSSGGGGRSYFPNTEGYTWRYRYTDGSSRVMTVEGTAVIPGDVTVQLFAACLLNSSGEVISTDDEYYRVTDSAVYIHGSPSYPINPGMPILEFPLTVGKSWVITSYGDSSQIASVTASESLTVPAGVFNCYKVSYVYKQGTLEVSGGDIWFGDGAGIVRVGSSSTIDAIVLEWKSF